MPEDSPAPLTLDPSETACVFIEYQNEFTSEGGKMYPAVKDCLDAVGTLDNSSKLLKAARESGCKVFHVPIAFEKGHNEVSSDPYGVLAGIKGAEAFESSTWSSELYSAMAPVDNEIVVKGKSGLCGFHSTNLDFLLRQNGVKNVVIAGFLTNCCVESTMRAAYERGYKVYTLKDCCAATSVAAHTNSFEHNFVLFSHVTESAEIIAAVSK